MRPPPKVSLPSGEGPTSACFIRERTFPPEDRSYWLPEGSPVTGMTLRVEKSFAWYTWFDRDCPGQGSFLLVTNLLESTLKARPYGSFSTSPIKSLPHWSRLFFMTCLRAVFHTSCSMLLHHHLSGCISAALWSIRDVGQATGRSTSTSSLRYACAPDETFFVVAKKRTSSRWQSKERKII